MLRTAASTHLNNTINFLKYGLIGSTEWVEDFPDWVSKHVVAYLNIGEFSYHEIRHRLTCLLQIRQLQAPNGCGGLPSPRARN